MCAVLVLCKSQHKPGTNCNICFLYLKVVLGHYAALSIPHTRPGTSFNMCFLYLKSCVGPLLCPHYAPHKARHQLSCVFLGPYAVLALCRSQCKPGTSFNVLLGLYVVLAHYAALSVPYIRPGTSFNVCFLGYNIALGLSFTLCTPNTKL